MLLLCASITDAEVLRCTTECSSPTAAATFHVKVDPPHPDVTLSFETNPPVVLYRGPSAWSTHAILAHLFVVSTMIPQNRSGHRTAACTIATGAGHRRLKLKLIFLIFLFFLCFGDFWSFGARRCSCVFRASEDTSKVYQPPHTRREKGENTSLEEMVVYAGVEGGGTTWRVSLAEGHPTNITDSKSFVTVDDSQEQLKEIKDWLSTRKYDCLGIGTFGPIDPRKVSSRVRLCSYIIRGHHFSHNQLPGEVRGCSGLSPAS